MTAIENQECRWKAQTFDNIGADLIVRIDMLADWHVGSGEGIPGGIDRLVQRDRHDLPFIPGKTLTGIWRDGCELAVRALDQGEASGPWHEVLDVLFGDEPTRPPRPRREEPGKDQKPSDNHRGPRRAAVSIRSAHLPAPLVKNLQGPAPGRHLLRDALTVVRPGVRIARATGMADPDHLRFVEMARGGLTLYAPVTIDLDLPSEVRKAAVALLTAGALMVEGLGGKRRRGAGRCDIRLLPNGTVNEALGWLGSNTTPPSKPLKTEVSLNPDPVSVAGAMEWLDLTVELDQPVSAPTRVVGNVGEGLDFVPGTNLLAWLAKHARVPLKPMIEAGTLRVLPLTLEVGGERGLPVPFALFTPKPGADQTAPKPTVINILRKDVPDKPQHQQVRAGFVCSRSPVRQASPPMVLQTHNTVDEQAQKPTTAVGGVYSYKAIAAGTRLRTRIGAPTEVMAKFEANLEPGTLIPLGRSRKDSYGGARVVAVSRGDRRLEPNPPAPNKRLTVWCLSDVLLRDERLRPDPSVRGLGRELGTALGVTLRPVDRKAMIRTRRLDGWQASWGLPRPSLIGIAAGSCAVFDVEGGSVDPAKVCEVTERGLGERRAEGYGDVWINPPLLTPESQEVWVSLDGTEPETDGGDQDRPSLTDDTLCLAKAIETEAWRRAIEQRAAEIVASEEWRQDALFWRASRQGETTKSSPNTSQLGTLRRLLRGLPETATHSAASNPVIAWMDGRPDDKGEVPSSHVSPQAKDKWTDDQIGRLRSLVSEAGTVWTDRGLGETWGAPPIISGRSLSEVQAEHWRHAVRAVLLAAIRAHKRDLDAVRKQSTRSDAPSTQEAADGTHD